jgi:hypothetical protein
MGRFQPLSVTFQQGTIILTYAARGEPQARDSESRVHVTTSECQVRIDKEAVAA